MCGDSTGSGGSNTSGSGGGNSMNDYLPSNYRSMSQSDKIDAIDNAEDKLFNENNKLFEDVKSGEKIQGSKEVMVELNRINKVTEQLEKEKQSFL